MPRPSRHAVTGFIVMGTCVIVLAAVLLWFLHSLMRGMQSVPW